MSYKKSYSKKYRKKCPPRRTNFTYGQVLDKVVGDVSKLKGLINVEFKVIDVVTASVVTTTPVIAVINACVQGDDFDQRDGRKVRFKSVSIKLHIRMHATPTSDTLRIMLVIDKQPNEIVMVIGDLLNNTDPEGQRNLDQRKRFTILRDDTITLDTGQGILRMWEYYKKLDMITIYDDSNAGNITDITTNALYLVLFGTEATNGMTIGRTTRLRFIDN